MWLWCLMRSKRLCTISMSEGLLTIIRKINEPVFWYPSCQAHACFFLVHSILFRHMPSIQQYIWQQIFYTKWFERLWKVWSVLRYLIDRGQSISEQSFLSNNQLATRSIVYKDWNPFSADGSYIYFVLDVPHLIKMTGNCLSDSFGHSYKHA